MAIDPLESHVKQAVVEDVLPARSQPQFFLVFLQRLAFKSLVIIAPLVFAGAAIAAYQIYVVLRGEITAPAEGSSAARVVEIEGFTKNIPPEHQYIWVAVDVPGLGLCWPTRQIYSVNAAFKTKILELGPNADFTVSLYAVPRFIHKDILEWIEDCRFTQTETGFKMISDHSKLDSITLKLETV